MREGVDAVWIKRSHRDTQYYHTNEGCPYLPDDESRYRAVAKAKLNDAYHFCKDCDPDHERDYGSVGTIECPQCGDEVSANELRSHLPCGGDADA